MLSECISVLKSWLEFARANLTKVQHRHGQEYLVLKGRKLTGAEPVRVSDFGIVSATYLL